MIKKILFVQIVSLILCNCSSFPLEEKSESYISDGLSKDEKTLIKHQIENKWIPVVGDFENIKVTISLELEIDGAVTKAEITRLTCPPRAEEMCRLVAETTKNAAKNASPIKNLQPDRYDIWKNFDLEFDPSNYRSQQSKHSL